MDHSKVSSTLTGASLATTSDAALSATASLITESRLHQRLGPYRLEQLLGVGGMGAVYRALDERYGTNVAVKVVPTSLDETRRGALKREFRTMCEFAHPNVVEMYDLRADADSVYAVMELVDGEEFVHAMSQPASLGLHGERLLQAVAQLASGLAGLHRARFIHRDIKSANVLVERRTGRVVILDFGLAETLDSPRTSSVRLLGTRSHMAPELLSGGAGSPASDWYALGVMLFEVLLGKPATSTPVREQALHAVAAQSLLWQQRLLALVADLLQPEPSQRPTASEVSQRLGVVLPEPAARVEVPVTLVGRESELAQLTQVWAEVCAGAGVSVAVSGDPGVGKSFLTDAFLEGLERDGQALVCRSRCHVNERIPFNAVDRLVDTLCRHVRLDATSDDDLDALAAIAELFPALGAALPVRAPSGPRPELAPGERRVRAFAELRRLVCELAELRPLVLFIDDAHWADADSARLLREVCGAGDSAAPRVLLLWTERSASEESAFLKEMRGVWAPRKILIAALEPSAAGALAHRLLPEASERDVAALVSGASGNPLMLVKAATQALTAGSAPVLALEALIDNDLQRLDLPLRGLLSIVALAGAPVAVDVAFRAAGNRADVHRALLALRRARLVAVSAVDDSAPSGTIELYHETLREPLLAAVSGAHRVQLHGALARSLEASPGTRASLLATHFHAAGEDAKAADYAERAGSDAVATLAFAAAAQHLRDALHWGAPQERRASLQSRLAESLFHAGHCAESGEAYAQLSDDATTELGRRLAIQQSTAWFSAGYVERAMACIAPVLQRLGLGAPSDRWLMLAIAGQVLRLRWRGVAYALDGTPSDDARALRTDVCWSVGQGMSMFLTRRGAYFALRSLLEAGRSGEARRVGRGLAFLGGVCANLGPAFAPFGERCLARAEAIGREHSDWVVLGWSHVWRANRALVACRFHEAIELAEAGTDLMERGGYAMSWECHTARCFALMARERLGNLLEVERRARAIAQRAHARDDLYGRVVFGLLEAQAALVQGSPERALQLSEQAMQRWTQQHFTIQHFYALRLSVWCALYDGKPNEAWQELSSAWPTVSRSDAVDVPSARLDGLLLRAQVVLALARGAGATNEPWLRQARKLRAQVNKQSPEGVAHALLLASCEQRLSRDHSRAKALAAQAAGEFQRLGMALWSNVALRAAAIADEDLDGAARAETEMRELGVAEPARWASLSAPGF